MAYRLEDFLECPKRGAVGRASQLIEVLRAWFYRGPQITQVSLVQAGEKLQMTS